MTERKLSIFGELSCVSKNFDTFEKQESVVSHDKALLFFRDDGVSDVLSFDILGVWSFSDELLQSLRSGGYCVHVCIWIKTSLHIEVSLLSVLTLTSQGDVHFRSLS